LDRFVVLSGFILWAGSPQVKAENPDKGIEELISGLAGPDPVVKEIERLRKEIQQDQLEYRKKSAKKEDGDKAEIWLVSLNRRAVPALEKSVPAVKADAARTLFKVKCNDIRWAILDSGIDGTHPVFLDGSGKPRIVQAFDFKNVRKILSLDNLYTKSAGFKRRLAELRSGREDSLSEEQATSILRELAEDAENDRPVHWELVSEFIKIDPRTEPQWGHGTHVAGIIGANGDVIKAGKGGKGKGKKDDKKDSEFTSGMCPDIKLYDFRVLGETLMDTEFAIIAALQYIRYLNERNSFITIHGANLSLSIPHEVRNYACGRTPICNECERLVDSGVVVVAAAGNLGYHQFQTKAGYYPGYAAFSITDPGNADGVITVGATHRFWPHTYGVSFFSSRGPTGDGRMKPDIVAPGERIRSCMPGNAWSELDGTSMAAPHVSGAAAMLLARYSELVGQPRQIKRILCESATDLGRERSFQGHGMLDVLRAFQHI
jgi:hypothetical protein